MIRELATIFVVGLNVIGLSVLTIAKFVGNEEDWSYKGSGKKGLAFQVLYFLALLIALGILN